MNHICVCARGNLFHVRFADVEPAAYDAGSWDGVGCRTRTVNDVACRHGPSVEDSRGNQAPHAGQVREHRRYAESVPEGHVLKHELCVKDEPQKQEQKAGGAASTTASGSTCSSAGDSRPAGIGGLSGEVMTLPSTSGNQRSRAGCRLSWLIHKLFLKSAS